MPDPIPPNRHEQGRPAEHHGARHTAVGASYQPRNRPRRRVVRAPETVSRTGLWWLVALCAVALVGEVWMVRHIQLGGGWPLGWVDLLLHWPTAVVQQVGLGVAITVLVGIALFTEAFREIPAGDSYLVSIAVAYASVCVLPFLVALIVLLVALVVGIIATAVVLVVVVVIGIGIAAAFG